MKTLSLAAVLGVSAAMLTSGCSTPASRAMHDASDHANSTQPASRVAELSLVTIDGIPLDPRLKPVYTYVKAIQTGDLELFADSCSTPVRKYLFADIKQEFEKIRMEFASRYGKANARDFTYEYKEQQPFGMACYKHVGRGGGFYVEKEGNAWRISMTPDDVKRFAEKNKNAAEPEPDGDGLKPAP